jgi:CheY-like chemotaxis protein
MSSSESQLAGAAIVVADDHADSADLLAMMLEREGADARTAGNGREVLDLLASFRPDVFLLDITLPDMDGYQLLQAIREVPGFDRTPAVAVTGHAYERDKERATAAGFAVHVMKPFDREALLHVVAELVPARAASAGAAAEAPPLPVLRQILRADGVIAALRFLNARVPHRFTGIYRFDGKTLRNLHLVDRTEPGRTRGDDPPLDATYCSLVGLERRPFSTADAGSDERLTHHLARENVQSYCGALLRNADGTPFGSLCHFDVVPRPVPPDEIAVLAGVAPWIAREVAGT